MRTRASVPLVDSVIHLNRVSRRHVREEGTVLIVVLLALMIMALIGMVIARTATTEVELAGNYRGGNHAFYAADGGAEVGLNELLDLGRQLGRFPTNAELASVSPPPLSGASYTQFSIQTQGPEVVMPLATGFYQGLIATTQPFVATATAETNSYPVGAATVELTTDFDIIPIFQFAVFYEGDLELLPGPNMVLNGRVHSNSDIYLGSNSTLTIDSAVTSAGDVFNTRKNNGLSMPGSVNIRDAQGIFQPMNGLDSTNPDWTNQAITTWDGNLRSQDHDVQRLNLTIEDPQNPRTIIEPGRPGDTLGQQSAKIYYDAGLRILDGQGFDASGNPVSLIDPLTGTSAIRETVIFDQREQKDMLTVEIDIDKLGRTPAYPANGVIYTGSFEPVNGMPPWQGGAAGVGPPAWSGYSLPWSGTDTTDFGIKLTNGAELPSPMTVVSDNPIYVQGDYNTVNKKGAAVMGDAVSVLSNRWGDTDGDGDFDDDLAYSQLSLNSRNALSTTVNAAFMTGNTNTIPGVQYNGGVENLPRFLERWTGDTFTYRGSLIDLWNSVHATGAWRYGSPVYKAPIRDWAFDTDFLSIANQPPATPRVYTMRVTSWDRR
ncbi:MAG: PilX N-terminal domain-containing pilus assembly protein [Acidobacteriota bacterium]